MTERNRIPLSETAAKNIAYFESAEWREVVNAIFSTNPTAAQSLTFIERELVEALDSLEPMAPDNGRALDGFHAGCCVLRAWSELTRLRKLIAVGVLIILSAATPARAEDNPLKWTSHGKAAARISDVAVWTNIAGETIASLRAEHRGRALGCQALRTGLVIGGAELTKRLVHRTRPDGSDRKSFFSEHTALAFVNTGWRYQVSVPIALGTGYLRPAANKHYISDVLAGAGFGVLVSRVCGP